MTNDTIAQTTAKILLDTQSVMFNAAEPFTYVSGKSGPVYIDCRRLISFPEQRSQLMDFAVQKLSSLKIDYLAGGETAGIPYAAFIAEKMNKPMVYVRKKPKGHGRMAQIEGCMEGDTPNLVLIEDLMTVGTSQKSFVDGIRQAGACVEHSFVIFFYEIFPAAQDNLKEMGLTLHHLCTWWDVLHVARDNDYFDAATLSSVESFLNDPEKWAA